MRSWIAAFAVTALAVASPAASARAQSVEPTLATAFDRAERDFDAVREELALGGSAPLVGLETPRDRATPVAGREKAATKPGGHARPKAHARAKSGAH